MFYNAIENTDLTLPHVQDLMNSYWDFFIHTKEQDVYMLASDMKYAKNAEPCEDIIFPELEKAMKSFSKKYKNIDTWMVTFRENNDLLEVLDIVVVNGLRFYYLPHDEIVSFLTKYKVKVKEIMRKTLFSVLQDRPVIGNMVGCPTNGYCDSKQNKIRIRI